MTTDQLYIEEIPPPQPRRTKKEDTSVQFEVLDCKQLVYSSAIVALPHADEDYMAHHKALEEASPALIEECRSWLASKGFTNIDDAAVYWD